ncbi:hypothetical protein BREU_1665 [Bifidobacterium reuteri DSM 23975]|uniref:Uncharacterized protein n=1 Tax=Bifidobacterium reuteri DSM 23975 TaxID=1437610 RepID=A0A087CTK2_9BIFI|nr:hypothetical protein BREU_1665 [Bifidobacterium reuteri DSM 23975]
MDKRRDTPTDCLYQTCIKRKKKTLENLMFSRVLLKYPQRGGYGPASYRSISTTPGANKFTFITYKINHSNGSRFLPIDTQAVLLLIVIFMRLMVETTCDE